MNSVRGREEGTQNREGDYGNESVVSGEGHWLAVMMRCVNLGPAAQQDVCAPCMRLLVERASSGAWGWLYVFCLQSGSPGPPCRASQSLPTEVEPIGTDLRNSPSVLHRLVAVPLNAFGSVN